jgi:hypothetical protein
MLQMAFQRALQKDLPVLFAYIGWASKYDGTEPIIGGHRYLRTNPWDNSDIRAFTKEEQLYSCGIGRGTTPDRFHAVFLATLPKSQQMKIVGVYADAHGVEEHETRVTRSGRTWDSIWSRAFSDHAVLVPQGRRPTITDWAPGQGQRRWASGSSARTYPALLKLFSSLKTKLPHLLNEKTPEINDDQTYAGMEAKEGKHPMNPSGG